MKKLFTGSCKYCKHTMPLEMMYWHMKKCEKRKAEMERLDGRS